MISVLMRVEKTYCMEYEVELPDDNFEEWQLREHAMMQHDFEPMPDEEGWWHDDTDAYVVGWEEVEDVS